MRTLMLALLALILLTASTASCALSESDVDGGVSSASQAIKIADLPEGIGRGYPIVQAPARARELGEAAPGATAPDFAMQLEDGRTIHLSDLRGLPVMINFWATWCMPCRIEMPDIVRESNLDDELVVVAANVQESIDAIRPFAEEYGMNMPIARDADGALRDLYQIRGMPTSFFIDRDGNISSVWAGPLTGEQLQAHLDGIR